MSSRVRFLLQDLVNGNAYVGKAALNQLQSLYKSWEKRASTPKGTHVWELTAEEMSADTCFARSRQYLPPDTMSCTVNWQGPGRYKIFERAVPPIQIPELPSGPRWSVALEMWQRITPDLQGRYDLIVSRDNKRHSWRKSLCSPFATRWGYKAKQKPKSNIKLAMPDFRDLAEGDAPIRTKPGKPRVGIWI